MTDVTDVEETATDVIDDIIAALGALSPLGSLIVSALSLFGFSTGNIASYLTLIASLDSFISTWESTLVSLAESGYTAFTEMVSFFSGLADIFSSSDETTASAKPLFSAKKVDHETALGYVSSIKGFLNDIKTNLPDCKTVEEQRKVIATAKAKWKAA